MISSSSVVASIALFPDPALLALHAEALELALDLLVLRDCAGDRRRRRIVAAQQRRERAQECEHQRQEEQRDAGEPWELRPGQRQAQRRVGADSLGVARGGHVPGALEQRGREDAEHQQRKKIEQRARARAEVDVERVDAHVPARDQHVAPSTSWSPPRTGNEEISSDPEKTKPVPRMAPTPLRSSTSARDDGRGRKEHCAAHPDRDARERGDGRPKLLIRCNQGPDALLLRAHPQVAGSVGLGGQAVLLADRLGPLRGASLAAALGPALQDDVVERLRRVP